MKHNKNLSTLKLFKLKSTLFKRRMLKLSELQLKHPNKRQWLLFWPKEHLLMKLKQRLPPLLFKRMFNKPSMILSRNKKSENKKELMNINIG
jgi:hypothetical protein